LIIFSHGDQDVGNAGQLLQQHAGALGEQEGLFGTGSLWSRIVTWNLALSSSGRNDPGKI
jgi:hypothetical protein